MKSRDPQPLPRLRRCALALACALTPGCRLLPQYNLYDATVHDARDAATDARRVRDGSLLDASDAADADAADAADARPTDAPRDAPGPFDPCLAPVAAIEQPFETVSGTYPNATDAPNPLSAFASHCVPGPSAPQWTVRSYVLRTSWPMGVLVRPMALSQFDIVSLRRDCDAPETEFACGNPGQPLRAIIPPGRYALLIAAQWSPGRPLGAPYSFDFARFTPDSNAVCPNARPLVPGVGLREVSLVGGGPPLPGCNSTVLPACVSVALPRPRTDAALFYTLTVPAAHRAVVTAFSPGGAVAVSLRARCDSDHCLAGSMSFPSDRGLAQRSAYDNHTNDAQTVIVEVRGPPSDTPSTAIAFDLDVQLARAEPSPPNGACARAQPLDDRAALRSEALDGAPIAAVTPCASVCVRSRYYSVSVPPGWSMRGVARVDLAAGWSPRLDLTFGCDTVCLGTGLDGFDTGARTSTAAFANDVVSAAPVTLAVGGPATVSGMRFDLDVDVRPPVSNATCAGATPLSDGAVVRGEEPLRGSPGALCPDSSTRRALYYSAVVPPDSFLALTSRPRVASGAWSVRWSVGAACGVEDCADAITDTLRLDGSSYFALVNRAEVTQQFVLGHQAPAARIPFDLLNSYDLTAAIAPRPAHVRCEQARPVAPGTTLVDEPVAAGDVSFVCGTGTATELYYRTTVPARSTLDVTAVTRGLTAPIVTVHSACDLTACLPTVPGFSVAFGQHVLYPNPTDDQREVIVAVGANRSLSVGTAPVTVSFAVR